MEEASLFCEIFLQGEVKFQLSLFTFTCQKKRNSSAGQQTKEIKEKVRKAKENGIHFEKEPVSRLVSYYTSLLILFLANCTVCTSRQGDQQTRRQFTGNFYTTRKVYVIKLRCTACWLLPAKLLGLSFLCCKLLQVLCSYFESFSN